MSQQAYEITKIWVDKGQKSFTIKKGRKGVVRIYRHDDDYIVEFKNKRIRLIEDMFVIMREAIPVSEEENNEIQSSFQEGLLEYLLKRHTKQDEDHIH